MFTGLSAFPLTPLNRNAVDEAAFTGLLDRLAAAQVDSITVLGSTGSYAYLTSGERHRVAEIAVGAAGGIPVFVGIGALRTSEVLTNAANAEKAGASGLLLAPVSYQPLTENEVFGLFRTVSQHTAVPVIVYDNPGTTRFSFSPGLYGRIAALDGVASIKIPGLPSSPDRAAAYLRELRAVVPADVTIGISGDAGAAAGLAAGCDAWYSVIGGTLPVLARGITRDALNGRIPQALAEAARLAPLWELFSEFGSLRVISAVAEYLGLVGSDNLPLPILGLAGEQRSRVAAVVQDLGLLA